MLAWQHTNVKQSSIMWSKKSDKRLILTYLKLVEEAGMQDLLLFILKNKYVVQTTISYSGIIDNNVHLT